MGILIPISSGHFQARSNPTRLLDNFPLQVNRTETLVSMENARHERSWRMVKLKQAGNVSDNMCQYGKRMFEDAVQQANSRQDSDKSPRSSCPSPTMSICSKIPSRNNDLVTNTGPTKYGSPLFNTRAKLMNTIRTFNRPISGSEQNRRQTFPQIQRTITGSNEIYRVSCVQPSQRPRYNSVMSLKDAILIPNQFKSSVREILEDDINALTAVSGCPVTNGRVHPSSDIPNGKEEVPELARAHMPSQSNGAYEKKGAEPETRQFESPEADVPGTPSQVRPTTPGLIAILEVADNPSGDEKGNESFLNNRHGNRCWVDSATVSSCSHPGDNNTDKISNEVGNQLTEKITKLQVGNSAKPVHGTPAEELTIDKPTNEQKQNLPSESEQLIDSKPIVVSLQQLQAEKCSLPTFMCPYSEEESKHAEIRRWLEKTRFSAARRSLPLV